MKLLSFFNKTFKENLRDWKILVMTLVFGPFFIYLMYAYMGTANSTYTVLLVNEDQQVVDSTGQVVSVGQDLLSRWQKLKYPDGKPILKIKPIKDGQKGKELLKNRDADLMLIIPSDFSLQWQKNRQQKSASLPRLINMGDPANTRYMIATSFADYAFYEYLTVAMGVQMPLSAIEYQTVGSGKRLNDFDLYVPALLVLAIIMVMFTAAASFIKEVDKGTIIRLTMSKLTTQEFLGAISLNQVLIGLISLLLTFLSALSCGYHVQGSIFLFFLVGAISTLGIIAIAILVAAFLRTIFELLTVGVFPFFVLMFFSESMFPFPRITLFKILDHTFYLNDILPPSLTVKAFNKILNFNASLGDVSFEIAGILILSSIYFSLGLWIFHRRHLRPVS